MKTNKMNLLGLALLSITLVLGLQNTALAKPGKKHHEHAKHTATSVSFEEKSPIGKGKKLSGSGGTNLSRDVVFDGSTVNGRYHTAGEAVTTVETEKKMNELVGFRRDFKDRLTAERARLQAASQENTVR